MNTNKWMSLAAALMVGALLMATAGSACAAEKSAIDWTAWREVPVYHNGRVMPLDSFATSAVTIISGRSRPTLSLSKYVSDDKLKSDELAQARSLFPDDKPRKFQDYELLLSWIFEPQKWEEVPFLKAEHDELLTKYFDMEEPITEKGEHIKYLSPRQVQESTAFQIRLEELAEEQQAARAEGKEFKLTGVDKKVDELWQSFQLYRQMIFDPTLDNRALGRFSKSLRSLAATWTPLEQELELFVRDDPAGLGAAIGEVRPTLEKLATLGENPRLTAAEIEPPASQLAASTRTIAEQFASLRSRLVQQHPPEWSADQVKKAQAMMDRLAGETQKLARLSDDIESSIYENREWLRVVPALNAAALEKDRDTADEAQPWLDLQTLLTGSPRALRDYPPTEVADVRTAFAKLKTTFDERNKRPNDFSADLENVNTSLAKLAAAIEPIREKLPVKGFDVALMEYTKYPAARAMDNEVRYNTSDPFLYSWILSLSALMCFGVVFIGMRRKMFWAGMAILAAGLLWTAYGFYLRVMITGWAPVTNMYETVVYVPFFVTMLGAWFVLTPMLWPGLQAAWRWTAAPFTWEMNGAADDLDNIRSTRNGTAVRANQFTLIEWVMLVPRIGLSILLLNILAIKPYAAGGRTIVNLLPQIDPGHMLPDFNSLLTWSVGLCVMIPTIWYLPRVILTLLLGIVTVPMQLRAERLASDGGKRRAKPADSKSTRSSTHKPSIVPAAVAATATAPTSFTAALDAHSSNSINQVYARWPFALAATGVAFAGSFIAWYSPVLDESFTPLQPVLRDNFWLLIHVLTIVSSYGAGALALGLGLISVGYYLFGSYRPAVSHLNVPAGFQPAGDGAGVVNEHHRAPEACSVLAGYIYKAMQVAVVLLATGTILGGLWADVAWGRFWGWDPKEVWALISLLVYVAVLHGRFAGWVGNFGLTAGTVLGGTAIIMSWYGVNFVLGQGLHSYGFGDSTQGQYYVFGTVAAIWGVLGGAFARYVSETDPWGRRTPVAAAQPVVEVKPPEQAAV